jgi:DNA-directed RNA polymerase specialized sigma24 family protein
LTAQGEDLTRRVYAYFIFRLRQPREAERLARLSFERVWEEARLSREVEQEPDLPTFAAARAVITDNPLGRGVSKIGGSRPADEGAEGDPTGLSSDLAMAIGRLHRRERDALALRFGGELTIGEIAELLDQTPAEIKQRLARGVRSLIALGVLPNESRASTPAVRRPRPAGSPNSTAKRPGAGGSKRGNAEQK